MAHHGTDYSAGESVAIVSTKYADELYSEDYRKLIGTKGKVVSIVIRENGHSYVVATNGFGTLPFKEWELEAAN